MTTIAQDDLYALLKERFGDDPMAWAFECPNCKDVATAEEFHNALVFQPRHRPDDGRAVTCFGLLGLACVGTVLGALEVPSAKEWKGRGCDWRANGLIGGPWTVVRPDGSTVYAFAPAEKARVS